MTADKEMRNVVSDDPSLSDEANAMVTRELRDVVGHDQVEVADDSSDHRHDAHAVHTAGGASLAEHRVELVVGALVVLVTVVLAFVAKDSGVWVIAPLVVLVAALVAVVRMILRLGTETEHVTPEVAAQLEAEGVANPDRMFTEMLEDFVDVAGDDDAGAVIRSGNNERSVESADSPANAAVQQRTAMTPSGHKSRPSAPGAGDDQQSEAR